MKCFELASATAYSLTALLAVHQTDRTTAADGGAFVQVGTHRMYVRCVGNAGSRPTVILESGGGGHSGDWTSVQSAVPSDIRTCAYDRAGLGRREKGPSPRTMKQEIFELHAMLAAANIKGPYVLVGQSIGGVTVRLYAQQYREDVAGMVLVDPTHESSVLGSLRYGGMVRLREKAAGRSVPAPRLVGPSDVPEQPDAITWLRSLRNCITFGRSPRDRWLTSRWWSSPQASARRRHRALRSTCGRDYATSAMRSYAV
jgi:pimeloyl-ACP methyl ester carboxylesterase